MRTMYDPAALPIHRSRPDDGEAYWFDGSLRVVRAQASTHGITAIEACIPEGVAPAYHLHEREYDIQLILEGEAIFHTGDTRFQARAGDLVSIPPGVPHSFLVTKGPYRALGLFPGDGFLQLIRLLGQPATARTLPPTHLDTRIDAAQVERALREAAAQGRTLTLDQRVLGPPQRVQTVDPSFKT